MHRRGGRLRVWRHGKLRIQPHVAAPEVGPGSARQVLQLARPAETTPAQRGGRAERQTGVIRELLPPVSYTHLRAHETSAHL
eukprot:7005-Alexandrium_andersonii.AAC.1